MRQTNLPFLICLFATLYNVGVIWLLQLNHYPLYAKVGRGEFQDYMTAHNRRILLPIVVPSVIAFASSLLLLWQRPFGVPVWSVWAVIFFNVVILLSTVLVQGRAHNALERDGYSEPLVQKIINTNWIRTVAWTINGLLLIWMTATALESKIN